MNNLLQVTAMTPKQILYSGPAIAVSSKNNQGAFDILGEHANFITIVENQAVVIYTPERKKIFFQFKQSIIYCTRNIVSIFANPIETDKTTTKEQLENNPS